jgi:guanylate kinase
VVFFPLCVDYTSFWWDVVSGVWFYKVFFQKKKIKQPFTDSNLRELNHKRAQKRLKEKTVHNTNFQYLPQIFIGASSSRRLGWLRKISLDTTQSCRISASERCTCFVVRPTFAAVSRRITSSSKAASIKNRLDTTQPHKEQKRNAQTE